jgi:hypothetical protein
MPEGDGRFIVGGPVLVVRRNGADAPLKVTSGVISAVTRAGYAYLRGDTNGFKLIEGCCAAWERAGEGARAPAWIVPDTASNRKLYADALRMSEKAREREAAGPDDSVTDSGHTSVGG